VSAIIQQVAVGIIGQAAATGHFHLLISEPEKGNPSVVMQVLKQRFARQVLSAWRARTPEAQGWLWDQTWEEAHVWQRRFYDFVVWSERKRTEKLRYMHCNPVKRGLVLEPGQWAWSSFHYYAYREVGRVLVNQPCGAKLKLRGQDSELGRGQRQAG
jgi:putative transposase